MDGGNAVLSVTDLNEYIKSLLDSSSLLARVYVRGEISNYKLYPSGHHYFTVKDQNAAIRCVMFKGNASSLRFRPENGMKVIVSGRVTVFPRDGAYQLYVSGITPEGVGDLYVAYEQLKEKLLGEGLFDQSHKKPIPMYPQRIAVITSSAGAAVRDIIRVLGKRYPLAKVLLLPVRVQGVEAPAEIAGAIRYANKYKIADVIITGRGGGSIEDLWAFNDERVARAIYASEIPVISAVGHEPDVTISDFVADLRAATPSNGAELCVPDVSELRETITQLDIRAYRAVTGEIKMMKKRTDELSQRRVMRDPMIYIDDKRLLLDHVRERMVSGFDREISKRRGTYLSLASKLDALSPLKVLSRGYSIAEKPDGGVIRSVNDTKQGERIKLLVSDGEINCTVADTEEQAWKKN